MMCDGASRHMPKSAQSGSVSKTHPRTNNNRANLFERGISIVACPLDWWTWRSFRCAFESPMKSHN